MKKALRETQTLHAGCSKVKPKNFAPLQTPSRGAGRPEFNQLETVTTYPQTQFAEDRCTQFRVSVVTEPQTNPQTDRTDYNTPRRSLASAECNKQVSVSVASGLLHCDLYDLR